jgi:hypothetical protein
MTARLLTWRRLVLLGLAFVLLGAAACTGGGNNPNPSASGLIPSGPGGPGSINGLMRGALQVSLVQAQSELTTGRNLFSFGLVTQNGGLLQGGAPQVWMAPDPAAQAKGPIPATFYRFTADERFKDSAPRSAITGFYVADVDLPGPGNWWFAAVASTGSQKAVGVGAMKVVTTPAAPGIGSKAISVKTPVATTLAGMRQIDTRNPPDTMHYISLDQALKNGRPTVVVFSTPLLCTSMMCGPVTDEVYAAFFKIGKQRANFIHVEEFLPGPKLQPPAPIEQNQSPPFKAWHLLTEPWVFVIDRHGIIRARFEGPVVTSQIEAALAPLLASKG